MIKLGEDHLPQLLFIHGGGVGSWMWNECIQQLTTHFQCLLVTLPYHGHSNSSLEDSPFTIESYTAKLLSQLQTYRNDQPIGVVGFSLGAQITAELLTQAPHLFKFAMINSALCTHTGISPSMLKFMLKLTYPLAKLKSFAKLQAKSLYIPFHLFDEYYLLSTSITASQLIEIMMTNITYRLKPAINLTTTNVHITYGEKENKAIRGSASELNKLLPQATIYVVPKLGHGFPLAEPIGFASYIKQHFN